MLDTHWPRRLKYTWDFLSNSSFLPSLLTVHNLWLAHGRSAALAEIGLLSLDILDTLGKDGGVLRSSILGSLRVAALKRNTVALVLEALWGNKALDLWCLGVWLLAFTLWLDCATDDEFANIIILGEAEELADLGGALRTKTLGGDNVGEAWELSLTLLDDGESEDGQVHGDNATADRLALTLAGAAWAVA